MVGGGLNFLKSFGAMSAGLIDYFYKNIYYLRVKLGAGALLEFSDSFLA
jgi:hypothetical protein